MFGKQLHSFHIPVLGISFSIDTPTKVAKYGISSVVSIVDDELIEDMRAYHCEQNELEFQPIAKKEHDSRALRITSYLNTIKQVVESQINKVKGMDFSIGSDLRKYFEMLPKNSPIKQLFEKMLAEPNNSKQIQLQDELKELVEAGSIDVNIMAKVDNQQYTKSGEKMADEYSDALSALRGYANSDLSSSVIVSAGYNPKLFNYFEEFSDFYPTSLSILRKKIVLKVSDYRSAMVQGKILAKKGLWVSEFRIESGLNCGGHAFATEGMLMGPILEEFKNNRQSLRQELFELCNEMLKQKGKPHFSTMPEQKVTAQGGIGTAEEHETLLSYYQLDGAGWGSPFLLVPEATNMDDKTLFQLSTAKKEEFYLSDASPLGVPFHNFKRTTSDEQRKERIAKGRPGSPCYKKYLSSNTEFTDKPICTASRQYQDLKIKQLKASNIAAKELEKEISKVEEKDCLCEGLSSGVRINNKMAIPHKLSAVAVCPGPNLAYFTGVFSLKSMINHIYGNENLNNKLERPHMFINELKLYVDYLHKKIAECRDSISEKQSKYFDKFKSNLQAGIEYYKTNHRLTMELPINMKHLMSIDFQLKKTEITPVLV
ncbi:MAG: hypothetical protein M9916_08270 [Crocinitomicaceae bacterium]|nr:hypothetical protein [Crocinitomicaceae bacterium]